MPFEVRLPKIHININFAFSQPAEEPQEIPNKSFAKLVANDTEII
jgi:hypothetical protein